MCARKSVFLHNKCVFCSIDQCQKGWDPKENWKVTRKWKLANKVYFAFLSNIFEFYTVHM